MLLVDTSFFKNLLQERRISGRSFARRLGIDPSAFSRMINNKRGMYPDEMNKIAAYLGISLDEVMRRAGVREGASVENTVRVIGRLTGLGEIELYGESRKPEHVAAPTDVPPDASAVVADTSETALELIDGWTYFIGHRTMQPGELLGRQVVACVAGEKRARFGFLKRSHRAGTFNLLPPGGLEAIRGATIEWAAPVIWIKP